MKLGLTLEKHFAIDLAPLAPCPPFVWNDFEFKRMILGYLWSNRLVMAEKLFNGFMNSGIVCPSCSY